MIRILIFGLLIFMLSGCSGNQNSNSISFAVGGAPNEFSFWETIAAQFQEQTGIRVNLVRQPTDTDQRRQGLVIALKSKKNDPDVFLMDVAWIAQFAASGWLMPLDSIMLARSFDDSIFFENIINLTNRYDGDLISLPVYIDGGLLYYRADLLKEHGYDSPPKSWAQLVEYAKKIQTAQRVSNPSFYGFVWQGAQYEGLVCTFLEFAGSNNGGISIDNNTISIETSQNKEALEFMHRLIHSDKISPPSTFTDMQEEQVRSFFQQGNALFERNWPYAWALHREDGSPVKASVGIAPLPAFPGGTSTSTLGGWHVGISKYSDAKEQAWKFVEFISSRDTQKNLALKLGWNPGRKDLYFDSTVIAQLPHFTKLRDVFQNARPRPIVPYYTQISEILQRRINASLAGTITPERALKLAQEETQEIVNRYTEDP